MFKKLADLWYRLSIRNKQFIFFTVIIIFVSWISFFSLRTAYSFMDEFNNNLTSYFNINKLLDQAITNRQSAERYVKDMDPKDLKTYQRTKDEILKQLDIVDKESNTNLEAYFLIRAIRNSLEVYLEEFDAAISGRQEKVENYYIYLYDAMRINEYTKNYIQQLLYNQLSEGSKSYKQLVYKAYDMRSLLFAAIVFIVMLCIGFAVFFSNYLTLSIRNLAAASNQISKGNFSADDIKVKSLDEVGMLAVAFNRMSFSIRRMMDDLTQKSIIEKKLHEEEMKNMKMQQLLKEAEFMGLQSQINPHFLFNTLNIISRVSMFEKADSTTKLIQSLSSLFRYNLGKYSKNITLAKEIEIAIEYLHIQQYRFGERIKFDVRCCMDAGSVQVPCFTLQPLVENAIIHGIEPKENGGMLRIKVAEKGGMVVVRVIDNGMGMSREKINSILNCCEERPEWHVTGIGLNNVISRMKLFFDYEDCMKIWSKEGLGTVITISFPSRKGDVNLVQAIDS